MTVGEMKASIRFNQILQDLTKLWMLELMVYKMKDDALLHWDEPMFNNGADINSDQINVHEGAVCDDVDVVSIPTKTINLAQTEISKYCTPSATGALQCLYQVTTIPSRSYCITVQYKRFARVFSHLLASERCQQSTLSNWKSETRSRL